MGGSSNSILLDTNVSNFVSVKLSGSRNYLLWKAQMLCLLDSNNLRGIVDDTFVAPKDYGSDTMRQYDSLVKGWIFGSVNEDVLVDVFSLGSANAVWEKLKSIYDPTVFLQEDSTPKQSDAKTENENIDVVSAETNTLDQGAIPIEIVVPNNEDTRNSENKFIHKNLHDLSQVHKILCEARLYGGLALLEHKLRDHKNLVTESISSDGSTILHIAVGIGHNRFMKNLLSLMNEEQVLRKRDSDGSTALHVAAIVGNKHAAELLVKKNRKLLRIVDHKGEEPLYKAYENMHLDTIVYLLKAVKDDGKTESESCLVGSFHPGVEIMVEILVNAISAKQYSLALELVKSFPMVASQSDDVLMAIAKTFPSGLDDGEKLIYPMFQHFVRSIRRAASFYAFLFYSLPYRKRHNPIVVMLLDVAFLIDVSMWMMPVILITLLILIVCFIFHFFYFVMWKSAKILVGPIKHMENKQKEWDVATRVLEMVCDEIDNLEYTGTHQPYYTRPIIEATCHNAYKVVHEILSRSPKVIQSTDKNGYDIIQLAIIRRSERIYNLIYDIGERKNLYRTIVDSSKNNILHLVGRLVPSSVLNQRIGAALQLQRELQWREEVKKLVFPTYITKENMFKETPDMVFTREHKNLVKEGERWMKTTAESCSITAALITTIVFAAAITVPRGSNENKGTPLLKKEVAFIIFSISDAISLFASTTALLVFLSILTACFAENDFLFSLPRRLLIGLSSLLLGTTAMMVAFGATLFLVFCDKKPWMLVPVCGLAFIPIASFVTLQFPLMADLFMSTYFHKFHREWSPIFKNNPVDLWS